MIHNKPLRRRISLGLLATGGALFLLAPENAWIGIGFLVLGGLLEVLGVRMGHSGPDES